MQSDEQLMQRYLKGDQRAFATLHARHEPLVRRVVARAVAGPADVDDLVQQTFAQLHVARRRYRSGALLVPWLCTMARNLCRDHHRWRRRRPEVPCSLDDLSLSAPTQAPVMPHDRPLVAALDVLPEPTRQIVAQHFLEDRALVDIARDLGAQPGTVRVRLHRGCQQLRAALQDAERGAPELGTARPAPLVRDCSQAGGESSWSSSEDVPR